MSNNIPCAVCDWTETAHDMAKKYYKRGWYKQCRHKYVSACDVIQRRTTARQRSSSSVRRGSRASSGRA